jgi:hypothetical protein
MQRAVEEACQRNRVGGSRNPEHARRHASACIHSFIDHQIRAQLLTLFDHGRSDVLRGYVGKHGHAELLITQIGVTPSGFLDRPVHL